ncbi:MAG: hypothetical protein KJO64_05550, partial [Bacteroidia bacterium]|nr:hypothetical protein [Bacteroidia bacterium]
KTAKGQAMFFGTLLDSQGEWLDTVHFPPYSQRYPFRGRGIYEIKGKVLEEFGCYNVEVSVMRKLDIVPDPRYADMKTANRISMQGQKRKSLRQFG